MLIVTGRLTVAAEDRDRFVADLDRVAEAARAQEACELFMTGSQHGSPGSILVIEQWRGRDDQARFLRDADVQSFARRWEGRMRNELRQFEVDPLRAP